MKCLLSIHLTSFVSRVNTIHAAGFFAVFGGWLPRLNRDQKNSLNNKPICHLGDIAQFERLVKTIHRPGAD